MVMTKALTDFGLCASKMDPQVFPKRLENKMVLIVSTHVDDLKGGDRVEERNQLIEHLEKRFGKLKTELGDFNHVGTAHEQDPVTKEIFMRQNAYAAQCSATAHSDGRHSLCRAGRPRDP